MKLKVLAVSLLAFFTFAGMAQAVVAVPTQLTPNEGETVYVDPVSGVTLTIGVTPEDAGLFPEVEASLSSTTQPSGKFADPIPFRSIGLATHDPSIDEVKISPFEFQNSGALATGTTTGTVYWHTELHGIEFPEKEQPVGSGQFIESEEFVERYGTNRSFNFTTVKAAPAPAPVLSEPAPVKGPKCSSWRSIDKTRLAFARAAAKKFNHAKTHGERNYWYAQLKIRTRSVKEAHRKVQQFCP